MVILIKIYQYRDYANVDDEEDRSNIFLISFHYLLHVTESIEDFGLCRGYWQFPMERVCGMLIPLEFGRPPRCIFKHHAKYKAEELANWITLYSVPLFKHYMQNK